MRSIFLVDVYLKNSTIFTKRYGQLRRNTTAFRKKSIFLLGEICLYEILSKRNGIVFIIPKLLHITSKQYAFSIFHQITNNK